MTSREEYSRGLLRFLGIRPPYNWEDVRREILKAIKSDKIEDTERPLPMVCGKELLWPDIGEVITVLASKIKGNYSPDKVVGIEVVGVGGGGIIAGLLSRELKIPMDVISFQRKATSKSLCEYEVVETSIDVENQKLILVDDVLFSGYTMKAAIEYLEDKKKPAEIRTATLVVCERSKKRAPLVIPDYFICEAEGASFKMPWGNTQSSTVGRVH